MLPPARAQDLLDRLLERHPVASALELDLTGRRFLDRAADRIPRVCRVPAPPGDQERARPGERFELVCALDLLDASAPHRELLLGWASSRLGHRGHLLVSAAGRRDGVREKYRRLRHRQQRPLGPEEAEDVLADAGFLLEDIAVSGRWDPRTAPGLVLVATTR